MTEHENSMKRLAELRRADLVSLNKAITASDAELGKIAERIGEDERLFRQEKKKRADLERVRRGTNMSLEQIISGDL